MSYPTPTTGSFADRPLVVLTGGLRPGAFLHGFVRGWYTWPFARMYVGHSGIRLRLRPRFIRWIASRNSTTVQPLSKNSGLCLPWTEIADIKIARPSIPGGFSQVDIWIGVGSRWCFFATTFADAQRVKAYADEFMAPVNRQPLARSQAL